MRIYSDFLIFYVVRTFGLVQGSVFFGRFGGSKFIFRVRTLVQKVQGSVFLRFGKFEIRYFQVRSKSSIEHFKSEMHMANKLKLHKKIIIC